MVGYLRFRSELRVVDAGNDLIFLLGDQEQHLLRGPLQARLVPLLNGTHTLETLFAELGGELPLADVAHILISLKEKGYLDSNHDSAAADAGFWRSLGVDPPTAQSRLAGSRARVSVADDVDIDPDQMHQALATAGIQVLSGDHITAAGESADIHIVLVQDYLPVLTGSQNSVISNLLANPQHGHTLLIKPTGRTLWWGPVLGPQGACFACLRDRLQANRVIDTYVRRRGYTTGRAPAPLQYPPGLATGLHLAAAAAARWLAEGKTSDLAENLLTLDLAPQRTAQHAVIPRPQCPQCGDPERRPHDASTRPVTLVSRPKSPIADGGYRAHTPDTTVAQLEPYISPITGFVTRLAPVAHDTHTMTRLWSAAHPVCPNRAQPGFHDFYMASWGKGSTDAQARASALGEAIERRSAVFHGDEPRIRATLTELGARGERALAPHTLEHFSDRQYRERDRINAHISHPRKYVSRPLDPDTEIEWTPVWSLTHGGHRYVPTQYCYNHYPAPAEERYAAFHSNGNAAGSCREEAILQGFLELVERDAVALWWFNRVPRAGIDFDRFDDPYPARLSAFLDGHGWTLWALDISTDLGIPAVVALACPPTQDRLAIGFGCHLDAGIAVRRALTELYQCFDPKDGRRMRELPGWGDFQLREHAYLTPDQQAGEGLPADRRAFPPRDDLRDDLNDCIARAASAGLETFVLDQSRPEIPMSAVKVIVPGLRHFWPRFGAGRLYDVPVEQGLLRSPNSEQSLNQLPIFW